MRNSIYAFIFALSISIIIAGYVSHLILFKKAITKTEDKLTILESNREYIESITELFNKEEDIDYNILIEKLSELESDSVEVEVKDVSSSLNPNFMDFTLFKYPPLRNILKENVTWRTLNDFREELGFTTDISKYDKFFKKDKNLFTIYNLPNINNAADYVLKSYYELYTGNEFKSTIFKDYVVQRRISQQLFDDKEYDKFLTTFDKDIKKTIGVIPSWNVNFVPETLLRTVLSKDYRGKKITSYGSKISQILDIRKNKLITDEELHNILQLNKKQKSAATYLGTTTTFWKISVIDRDNNLKTDFIYGWILDGYRLISFKSEPI